MQTYPFTIAGVMQYKEHARSDQSEIKLWPNAKLFLVDSEKNSRVYETTTDEHGNFSISVPYFSKYLIEVVDQSGDAYQASLEIQKYRVESSVHQIVIVKDIYSKNTEFK
jgi:hypothetical protein